MKVILLCGAGESSKIVASFIAENYTLEGIIVEEPLSKKRLIKGRIKKLGLWKTGLQVAFITLMVPLIDLLSRKRHAELRSKFKFQEWEAFENVIKVPSVNHEITRSIVTEKQPAVIVVNGTRIIGKKLLDSIQVPFLNLHVGITPMYRGVHGGYWALVNDDREHCGVTVHLIDQGIDTGSVICQQKIDPTKKDSFITYPLLQLKAGLSCLERALNGVGSGNLETIDTSGKESKLYYHPTITTYLYHRIFRGIK